MSWKIQILNQETGEWEDIEKEEYQDLESYEAQEMANHMNNLKPYKYRAVEA